MWILVILFMVSTGNDMYGQTAKSVSKDTLSFNLNEIVVTAKQTNVKLKGDKITFLVGKSVGGGVGSMYDILKTIPGIIIQNDGTIFLNGQGGVVILIDGKETYLSGSELCTFLKSIPSYSADKIDLITHPSVRYDANGKTSIIDIQTKKMGNRGFDILFNSDYSQGKDGEGHASTSLNLRKRKIYFHFIYSYYRGDWYNNLWVTRGFRKLHSSDTYLYLDQESRRRWSNYSHYFQSGFDYYATDKTTLGLSFTGSISHNKENSSMNDVFEKTYSQPDSSLNTIRYQPEERHYLAISTNMDHKIGTHGQSLNVYFDFLRYYYNKDQYLNSLSSLQVNPDSMKGNMGGTVYIYTGQANWNLPLGSCNMKAGIKSAFTSIDNKVDYKERRLSQWISDPTRNCRFIYKENINAAYVQLSKEGPKFSFDVGIRIEDTNTKGKLSGDEYPNDSSFTRHYINLFPLLSLEYRLNDNNKIAFSYNRRINRPKYNDMNPFLYIHDNYTYEQGNTNLKPELNDNCEITYLYKNLFQAGLFFNYTHDVILNNYIEKGNHQVYVTPDNLFYGISSGLRLNTINLPIFVFWNVNVNATFIYNYFRLPDDYNQKENQRFTSSLGLLNQFQLGKDWTIELSGSYNGKMATGQATIHPLYEANLGIEKKILGGNGSIKLFGHDIFHLYHLMMDLSTPTQQASTSERDNRLMVGLSFSYKFGRGMNLQKRHQDNSENENKRINL